MPITNAEDANYTFPDGSYINYGYTFRGETKYATKEEIEQILNNVDDPSEIKPFRRFVDYSNTTDYVTPPIAHIPMRVVKSKSGNLRIKTDISQISSGKYLPLSTLGTEPSKGYMQELATGGHRGLTDELVDTAKIVASKLNPLPVDVLGSLGVMGNARQIHEAQKEALAQESPELGNIAKVGDIASDLSGGILGAKAVLGQVGKIAKKAVPAISAEGALYSALGRGAKATLPTKGNVITKNIDKIANMAVNPTEAILKSIPKASNVLNTSTGRILTPIVGGAGDTALSQAVSMPTTEEDPKANAFKMATTYGNLPDLSTVALGAGLAGIPNLASAVKHQFPTLRTHAIEQETADTLLNAIKKNRPGVREATQGSPLAADKLKALANEFYTKGDTTFYTPLTGKEYHKQALNELELPFTDPTTQKDIAVNLQNVLSESIKQGQGLSTTFQKKIPPVLKQGETYKIKEIPSYIYEPSAANTIGWKRGKKDSTENWKKSFENKVYPYSNDLELEYQKKKALGELIDTMYHQTNDPINISDKNMKKVRDVAGNVKLVPVQATTLSSSPLGKISNMILDLNANWDNIADAPLWLQTLIKANRGQNFTKTQKKAVKDYLEEEFKRIASRTEQPQLASEYDKYRGAMHKELTRQESIRDVIGTNKVDIQEAQKNLNKLVYNRLEYNREPAQELLTLENTLAEKPPQHRTPEEDMIIDFLGNYRQLLEQPIQMGKHNTPPLSYEQINTLLKAKDNADIMNTRAYQDAKKALDKLQIEESIKYLNDPRLKSFEAALTRFIKAKKGETKGQQILSDYVNWKYNIGGFLETISNIPVLGGLIRPFSTALDTYISVKQGLHGLNKVSRNSYLPEDNLRAENPIELATAALLNTTNKRGRAFDVRRADIERSKSALNAIATGIERRAAQALDEEQEIEAQQNRRKK